MHCDQTKRIAILIPAHNEAENLPNVFEDLRKNFPQGDAIVIDDASSDQTARVARKLGAIVLSLPVNLGTGGAIQTGHRYALENGYDFAVQLDGDGQHRAQDIAALLEPVMDGRADMAIGSRFVDGTRYRQEFARRVGGRLFTSVLRLLLRQTFTDPTSGFRAFNRKVLRFFASHYPQGWLGDTVEALVEVVRHDMQVQEVAVKMRQRKHGTTEAHTMKGMWYTACVLLAIFIDLIERKHEIPAEEEAE